MPPLVELSPILTRRELRPGVVDLTVRAPGIAAAAKPGQFVHIKCGDDMLLRRPISLCDVEEDSLRLVIEAVGVGSRWLCERDAGEFLDLLGPLGDAGFPAPESGGPILLVGGGVGSAPLLMCARKVHEAGVAVDAVLGFGTAAAVIMEQDFAPHCRTVAVTTDDGSYGQPGFVTAAAEKLIAENRYQAVLACGNMTMLKAVHALTERLDVPCWLSLDERMGCGIGACLVCAVKLRGEDHSEYYGHVCKQGPVFRREEVVF